jgi:hypothetical protein
MYEEVLIDGRHQIWILLASFLLDQHQFKQIPGGLKGSCTYAMVHFVDVLLVPGQ